MATEQEKFDMLTTLTAATKAGTLRWNNRCLEALNNRHEPRGGHTGVTWQYDCRLPNGPVVRVYTHYDKEVYEVEVVDLMWVQLYDRATPIMRNAGIDLLKAIQLYFVTERERENAKREQKLEETMQALRSGASMT